jgi:hypothetical protein
VGVNRLHSGSRSDRWAVAGARPGAQPSPRDGDSNPEACLLGLQTEGRGPAAPPGRIFLRSMARISLSENLNRWYPCFHVPSTIQTGLATRDGFIEPREKAKNLELGFFGFFGFYPSQPFEIPRNRQRNLWKSLEKTARDLEMFGKSLEVGRGARKPNIPCRAA